jgi:Periplasmic binding protein
MEPVEDNESESRPSALRRFGPIAAALVVIALVAGFSLVGGGGDDDDGEESTGEAAAPTGELPEGVVTWSMAQEEGIDATFGDTCDTESGMVAIPFFFRTECIADFEGDNGGATADGVTGDTIKIVAWLPSDNDPIFELARRALGIDESIDDVRETYEGLVEIFQRYYQTYGRTVELEFVQASGTMLDPVAARADAVRAADMEPFAVLGGPLLANTWTEELHARGIVCMACPGTSDPAPSSFAILPSTSQIHQHVAEYIDTKLADKPAEFAGDDLNEDDRVFGLLYLAQTDNDEQNAEALVERLEDKGVEVAETVTYPLDPGRAQELSASAIARFKEAGVTTVILRADPITAPAFTNEATEQGFFPEWFLAGFQFTDTTTFARGFDQEQWEHAFGISFLPPLAAPEITPAYKLYEWYFGEPPAADNALILIYPQVALFFTGVEYAGPNLTVENLRDGLFAFPPTPSAVTQPSVDYGTTIWGDDDYAGIDDMVELWWDPEAEGVDETGQDGTGMYRYVDGGKRYLPGEYSAELTVFQEEGSVTRIEDPPPAEVPPDYPSPADS